MLVGIVLSNAASAGGISPISHVVCGELLPLSVRPLFGNVLSLYLGCMSLFFLNVFPLLRSEIGSAGLFTCLAGVNLALILHARFLLPETRGLSLEQVQLRHFSSKKKATPAAAEAGLEAETAKRSTEADLEMAEMAAVAEKETERREAAVDTMVGSEAEADADLTVDATPSAEAAKVGESK